MSRIILVLSMIGALSAADKLLIPMDPQQYKQLSESVLQAARDGDDAAVLVGGRHALELAPNDPELQAPIYLLMSFAARNSGEATLAEEYAAIAHTLDPSIESRMRNSGPATRGDTAGTIQNAANIFGAAFNSYEQIKMMKLCLDMVKHGMTPPPQCGGQGAGQAPVAGMPPPMPTQPGMPAMPPPMPMPTQPGMPGHASSDASSDAYAVRSQCGVSSGAGRVAGLSSAAGASSADAGMAGSGRSVTDAGNASSAADATAGADGAVAADDASWSGSGDAASAGESATSSGPAAVSSRRSGSD